MKKKLNEKQKFWDEYFEEKKFENVIQNKKDNKKNQSDNEKFFLETKLHLMEESLQKTKFNSSEFNTILDECIDIFLEIHPEVKNKIDKKNIVQLTKDRMLDDEIVGEFDGKKLKQDKKWPFMGRITLRDAIQKSFIGQNPKSKNSKTLKYIFYGDGIVDSQPSPSSDKK